jgi:hypothetical protein
MITEQQYIYLPGSDKLHNYGWFSDAKGNQPFDPKKWATDYQSVQSPHELSQQPEINLQ